MVDAYKWRPKPPRGRNKERIETSFTLTLTPGTLGSDGGAVQAARRERENPLPKKTTLSYNKEGANRGTPAP